MPGIDLRQRFALVIRTTALAWGLPPQPLRGSRPLRPQRPAKLTQPVRRACAPSQLLFAV